MEKGMEEEVARGTHCLQVLMANGKQDLKMRLGISNQDYPEARENAYRYLLEHVIVAQAAMDLIRDGRLYADGLEADLTDVVSATIKEILEDAAKRRASSARLAGAA